MAQSAIGAWIDLLSLFVLLGLVAAFAVQFFTPRPWWSRFWWTLSRQFNPLRQRHWALPAVFSVVFLTVVDVVAGDLGTGGPTLLLWFVFAGYGTWAFTKQHALGRFQRRRLMKAAEEDIGLPVSIWSSSSRFSMLDRWANAVALVPYSILLLGATRSGKTEVAKHIVIQMFYRFAAGVMVVFDYKTDYQDFFDTLGIDYIKLSLRNSTHIPNLFYEFEDELDVDEFARAMFPSGGDRRDGGSAEFFDKTSRQTFAAVLKMLWRERDDPDNRTVRRYFKQSSAEDIFNDLRGYDDFVAAASAINVETNAKRAGDVYSTLVSKVDEVFVGDFARSPDEAAGEQAFSFREAYEKPPGKPVVLDFPKNKGDSTKPLFRFYLDWAARFALDNPNQQDYFILDEFARIPHLRKIGDLLNVGAGDRVQVVAALQSINQMTANYGENRGKALLSGLVSKILLRANDSETVDFIRESIGTEFVEYTKHVEKRQSLIGDHQVETNRETKEEEEHAFAKGDIRKWDPGVGVVVLPDKWAFGYIPQLHAGHQDLYERAIFGDVITAEVVAGDEPEGGLESKDSGRLTEAVVDD